MKINNEFNVLGEYAQEVLKYAKQIEQDDALLAWGNMCVEYLSRIDDDEHKARALPMPQKAKEQTSLDVFPLLVLMGELPKAKKRYEKLGATKEEIDYTLASFNRSFIGQSKRFGKPCLPWLHYDWLCIYVYAKILDIYGFNFEITEFCHNGVYIKNNKTGKLVALMLNEKMHREGYVLGVPYKDDEEGSYLASFEETDDAFIGYPVNENGIAANKKQVFEKSEWSLCMKKGDMVISFHIPADADFSPENLDFALKNGVEKMRKYYKDYDIKGIICSSWLVSPQLKDIIKPTSNIVAFGERFTLLPQMNDGRAVFTFVFPPNIKRYEDLPEESSLEKGLKNLYLGGGCLYVYLGFIDI